MLSDLTIISLKKSILIPPAAQQQYTSCFNYGLDVISRLSGTSPHPSMVCLSSIAFHGTARSYSSCRPAFRNQVRRFSLAPLSLRFVVPSLPSGTGIC